MYKRLSYFYFFYNWINKETEGFHNESNPILNWWELYYPQEKRNEFAIRFEKKIRGYEGEGVRQDFVQPTPKENDNKEETFQKRRQDKLINVWE